MALKKKKLKSLTGRVIKIRDAQHFRKLCNDSRLCVILYTAAWKENTQTLRKALKEFSAARQYSHVLFAELDTEASALEEVIAEQGVDAPRAQAWRQGELLETAPGTKYALLMMLKTHAGNPPASNSKWASLGKKAVLAGAVVAAGVAAVIAARRFLGSKGDGGGMVGNLTREEAELLDIDEQIQALDVMLREEVEIEAKQKALEEQEKAEGIMRMPPMPGTEPAEKDKRNPGSPWFVERQQRLRTLRQREKELSQKLDAEEWA
ncbi:hypothetical protein WJX73_000782 [Symbiochloris irregularis]|uniref:Thioredoxin domain-containing protein n=1 Tax=Symbiochloris irregularis TaxID=706552 RepID=A0AAW1P3Y7_9CHLO